MVIRHNEKGLTLVEVVVSMALFLIVMGAVIGFYVTSSQVAKNNNEKTVALRLAQQAYERAKYKQITFKDPGTYNYESCKEGEDICMSKYRPFVNNRHYSIEYVVSEKNDVGINPIKIIIYTDSKKAMTSLDGFVE